MNCAQVRAVLEDYCERTLPSNRASAVAEHLAVCVGCAGELRQIERVASALSAVPPSQPAEDLLKAISARVAELAGPRERRLVAGWHWVAVTAAVSVAGLAMVSYLLPLLISERLASSVSALSDFKDAAGLIRHWFAAAPDLLLALWLMAGKVWQWFALAARAVAPTLGAYVLAEIGILSAIVFVFRARGRHIPVRQTLLL